MMMVVVLAAGAIGAIVTTALARSEHTGSPVEVRTIEGNKGEAIPGKVGEQLECYTGSWTGSPSFEYEWLREGQEVKRGSINSGAGLYTIQTADKGQYLECVVYAIEGNEESSEVSVNSVLVEGTHKVEKAPEDITLPSIGGTLTVGSTLTCSEGTWRNEPTSYTYQWLREVEGQQDPIGTNSSSYKVEKADAGHKLECKVTAKNNAGTAQATSAQVSIPAEKLEDLTLPEVQGSHEVGKVLTCNPGKWTGEPTFEYRWLRNEAEISGATNSTYTVVEADEGKSLACRVKAKGGASEQLTKTSEAVKIRERTPESKTLPKITGTAQVGKTLTCSRGTWTGNEASYSYSFTWVRNKNQTNEAVGFNEKYEVQPADKGQSLTCEVTATNREGAGSQPALSAPVIISNGGEVPSGGTPTINGSHTLGSTLTCNHGTWLHSPTEYAYQWLREVGGVKTPIGSATESEYEVKAADEGHELYCLVTASNEAGSGEATSAGVEIPSQAPVNETRPVVSGNPEVNESLACSTGKWSGAPTHYNYQWLRDVEGTDEPIGTNSAGYKVVQQDAGNGILCRVTAENGKGSAEALSNELHIGGIPPVNTATPTVTPTSATLGTELHCDPGTWTGEPTPTLTIQWMRAGGAIPGATGESYTVHTQDEGRAISCRVTGQNSEGKEVVTSNPVHIPGSKPKLVDPPVILGSAYVGDTLTCEHGIWEASPRPAFTYQWVRDGAPVAGQTANTYAIEPTDQGHLLTCVVTATNPEGFGEDESAGVGVQVTAPTRPPGGTTTGPGSTEKSLTKAQIVAALKKQIPPAQSSAHLASVRKSRSYSFSFKAPGAGKLEVFWYQVPKGAHVSAAKAKPKPVLVASCTVSYTSASRKTVKMRLTTAGRKLLARHTRVPLTVKAVFSAPHGVSGTWVGTFVLKH